MADNESKKRPSLSLIYDIALKSYDWMLGRADAWESNLDKILVWGTSINAGIVALVLNLHKDSCIVLQYTMWFWIAQSAFILAIILGFIGKFWGKFILPNPNVFWNEEKAMLPEDEFMRLAIQESAKHFRKNNNYVNMKAMSSNWIADLFILAVILDIVWAMGY